MIHIHIKLQGLVLEINIKEIVFVPKQQHSYIMTVASVSKIKIIERGHITPIFLDVNPFCCF